MAELADALDSGSNSCKAVQVQVLLPAPKIFWYHKVSGDFFIPFRTWTWEGLSVKKTVRWTVFSEERWGGYRMRSIGSPSHKYAKQTVNSCYPHHFEYSQGILPVNTQFFCFHLYAQIQCLLRLIPRFFTVFSVGLLKHFSLPLLKFLHLKNPCTEN